MALNTGQQALFDYLVIGAGIVGKCTAYELSKSSASVALLDQFFLPHTRGSSHGQSRISRNAYHNLAYSNLMPESYKIWNEVQSKTGKKLMYPSPLLVMAQKGNAYIESVKDVLTRNKIGSVNLDNKTIEHRFPTLDFSEKYDFALEENACILQADNCGSAVLDLFRKNGGQVFENTEVKTVVPGKTVQVISSSGLFSAKSIVVTAGPWTNKVLQTLDLTLPLKPVTISVCYWQTDDQRYKYENGFPMFIFEEDGSHVYGFPIFEYPGMIKVCHHTGESASPDARDTVKNAASINKLSNFISDHFKGVETRPSLTEKCMYTETPDSDFIIDCHPKYSNIVIGAGFSGHGFKMAPVTGKILAQLARQEEPKYDIKPFRIQRFNGRMSKL